MLHDVIQCFLNGISALPMAGIRGIVWLLSCLAEALELEAVFSFASPRGFLWILAPVFSLIGATLYSFSELGELLDLTSELDFDDLDLVDTNECDRNTFPLSELVSHSQYVTSSSTHMLLDCELTHFGGHGQYVENNSDSWVTDYLSLWGIETSVRSIFSTRPLTTSDTLNLKIEQQILDGFLGTDKINDDSESVVDNGSSERTQDRRFYRFSQQLWSFLPEEHIAVLGDVYRRLKLKKVSHELWKELFQQVLLMFWGLSIAKFENIFLSNRRHEVDE